jgi:hypothetical protein
MPEREGDAMSRTVHLGRRATLALAVGLLSLAAVPAFTLVGTGPAAAQQPPGLDHFLCYTATSPPSPVGKFKHPTVMLTNQFTPAGTPGIVTKVGAVSLHCNPVQKTITSTTPPTVYPITNPNAHLLCFGITAQQPSMTVIVTNQFGQGELVTSSPTKLCLPTWKSLTGPPGKKPNQPPGLGHFTCYPVTYAATGPRFKPPAGVLLQDQFAPQPVTAKVGAPELLCLPTQKTLASGKVFPIINPAAHLLCFGVSPTPIINPVFDQNQFGTNQVTIKPTKYLCLPSYKDLVTPPG